MCASVPSEIVRTDEATTERIVVPIVVEAVDDFVVVVVDRPGGGCRGTRGAGGSGSSHKPCTERRPNLRFVFLLFAGDDDEVVEEERPEELLLLPPEVVKDEEVAAASDARRRIVISSTGGGVQDSTSCVQLS
jgi:hypothetical protein